VSRVLVTVSQHVTVNDIECVLGTYVRVRLIVRSDVRSYGSIYIMITSELVILENLLIVG